jgi:hypothetical protein
MNDHQVPLFDETKICEWEATIEDVSQVHGFNVPVY